MAGQTIATLDAILKEDYGPQVVEELNEQVPFLKLLEKDAGIIPFDGREWTVPIHTGRNAGIGATPENGSMPTAGAQGYKAFKIGYTNQYGAVRVTAQTIEQTRTNKGAFVQAMESEMRLLRDQFRSDMNFQFLRNGQGTRATINAAGAGVTSITINPVPYNIIYENMLVDIYDSTLTTQKYSGVQITNVTIDYSTYTVTGLTLGTSVTVANTDVIVRKGNKGMEILGLDAAVGQAVYGGIDPTQGAASWASPVLGNSGTLRPINESIFQTAIDVAHRAGNGQLKYFFTTREIRKNFGLYMSNMRRVVNSKNYDGGFDSIEFDGKEVFVDDMAVQNTIYGIDPQWLKIVQTRDAHWIDNDGRVLRQSYDGTDSFFAQFRYFVNLACTKRNAQVKISDIQQ